MYDAEPVYLGHLKVCEDDVKRFLRKPCNGILSVGCTGDAVALIGEDFREVFPVGGFVVYYEYGMVSHNG